MRDPKNTDAPAGKRARAKNNPPAAPLSDDEQRSLSVGIAGMMGFAAALSAPTLYGLARLIGFAPQLAWLLPAALDGYAVTSIWFGRKVPAAHPAAKAARRNARLALALTVACNGLFHLLTLGGVLIPTGARVALLVTVSSLPPFLVDRLLHLRGLAAGSGAAVQPPTVQTPATPSIPKPRVTVQQGAVDERPQPEEPSSVLAVQPSTNGHLASSTGRRSDAVNDQPTVAQPSMDRWIEIGHPVYLDVRDATGKRPPEGAYRDALAAAVSAAVASGELPDSYADPSISTAKRVRKAVEERFPDLSPLHLVAVEAA